MLFGRSQNLIRNKGSLQRLWYGVLDVHDDPNDDEIRDALVFVDCYRAILLRLLKP